MNIIFFDINPGQKHNTNNMAKYHHKETLSVHNHHHHNHIHLHNHHDHDEDGIFSFDDEEHFTPPQQSQAPRLKKSKTVPIGLSTFYTDSDNYGPQADLQNEEIINIQPKNHFSFDIVDSSTPTNNNNNNYTANNNLKNTTNNNIWNQDFWNQKLEQKTRNEYSEDSSSSDLVSMIGNLSIKGNGGAATTTAATNRFFERPSSPDPNNYFYSSYHEEITIEDIRVQLHSCLTCGVYWREGQVSLDCRECGGYPLSRPCPTCDGECETQWNRNLAESHSLGRARWVGVCSKDSSSSSSLTSSP